MKSVDRNDPEKIEYLKRPELVIGLVGAVGLKWDQLIDVLREQFLRVNYAVVHIHLSHLLEEIFGSGENQDEKVDERVKRLMDQGDKLREILQHQDAVGFLSIAAIQRAREDAKNIRDLGSQSDRDRAIREMEIEPCDYATVPLSGCAYILRSLKTPAEVQLLRRVYGQFFS